MIGIFAGLASRKNDVAGIAHGAMNLAEGNGHETHPRPQSESASTKADGAGEAGSRKAATEPGEKQAIHPC
jgi:hypothetical protein